MIFINYPYTTKSPDNKWYYIDSAISFITLAMAVYFILHFITADEGVHQPFEPFNWLFILLALIVALVFFIPVKYWSRSESQLPIALDVALVLTAIFVVGYFIYQYQAINYRMGSENALDTAVSFVGILISLEASRRVLGWSMTLVGVVFLAYAFWGDVLHGIPILKAFAHTGFKIDRALNHIYYKQEGVFGIMATVLVTYVILFIFFGSFLKASGASRFFLDLPMALAGRTVGGPAKVAVMASGFFGSVSGSAIANTVSTGAFTIPLMKKAGFRPHVAGAIEPSASIGGMFMPPIMGAGGFIMAEMTEIPYVDIMLVAIFPAIIYFLSVFVMIHFEAKRYGLVGLQDEKAPSALQILKSQWFMSMPLVIIVVMMLMGFSPGYAAFWAILSCIFVSRHDTENRSDIKETLLYLAVGGGVFLVLAIGLPKFLDADASYGICAFCAIVATCVLETKFAKKNRMGIKELLNCMAEGSRSTLIIGATVGVIGIIVGTIQLTGIGLKFSQIIIDLSFGFLPLAILLIGLASLVLGMGVPVTAAYLITAVLAVGALTDMISRSMWGVGFSELQFPLGELLPGDPARDLITAKVAWALLASHMIVYWFSQDSNITPPVCVAAYAGAAIAGSEPWKTGWTAFKFAKMLYIGPFLFAFSPGFLLGGHFIGGSGHVIGWFQVISTWVTVILGTIAFGSVTMGYFLCGTTIAEWIVCAVATVLLFFPKIVNLISGLDLPTILIDGIGIGLWVLIYFKQKVRIHKDPSLTLPIHEREKLRSAPA
ncbi:MAG: TRAP transporter fused permease subunit [Desulfobacteraceae bacterium]|nr:TRAP transporter fused permease subunit [Desulfobacteraceae bacterium]